MRKAVSRIIPNRSRSFSDSNTNTNDAVSDQGSLNKPVAFSSFKIDFNSVSDFYIILDNPHNSWLPGDEISGQIILISKKNLANIIITLSLIGYVKVNASSHSNLRPIKHNLFNHTIKIYGNEGATGAGATGAPNTLAGTLGTPGTPTTPGGELSNGLFKGEHRFPFIVKLPNKRIYTSIDFGKGSITYLLRASMHDSSMVGTNDAPSPTTSPGFLSKTKNLKILNNTNYTSEKLINLVNPIDVSTLPTPKPKRLIIKDPRFKKLSRIQSSTSTINTFNTYSTLSSNNSDERETGHSPDQLEPIRSSQHQNGTSTQTEDDENPTFSTPATTIATQTPPGISYDLDSKPDTIKVSLLIPKRGYLRGELIPIKLNINHLRKVQDLNGIIVTFVRVCRLDNGPNGLYDSFRKDLVQSVVPLYVDPNTFQSEINTNVRVPADAFPTISDCPIVSFQYFIEVLINLSGKSVILDVGQTKATEAGRKSPIVDFASTNQHFNNDEHPNPAVKAIDNLNDVRLQYQYLSASDVNQSERSTFINTDKYKRMKKFLQLTSEVVVGTHRSKDGCPVNGTNGTNEAGLPNTPSDMQVSSPSRRSSSVSDTQPTTYNNGQGYSTPVPPGVGSSIQAIPESREYDNNIPDYHDIVNDIDLLPMPAGPQSEKERMRAHEDGLMASEPVLDAESRDSVSRDSVSPVTGVNGSMLDESEMASEPPQQQQQEQEFNFFSNDNDSNNIDYVPNYEGSNNDQLVEDSPQK